MNDNTIYGKNKKLYYDLYSKYNYYIDIDYRVILKQKCLRLLNNIQNDKIALNDLISNNEKFIKNFSEAIKTDGTLWTWGQNAFGVLGLGNTTYYSSPKQIGVLTNWSKVSPGKYTSSAIKTDGTLWTWGYNGQGQLGLGNITNYSSPKQVGTLTTWLTVAAGYGNFVLGIATT